MNRLLVPPLLLACWTVTNHALGIELVGVSGLAPQASAPALAVCLVLAPALAIDHTEAAIFAEMNAIWKPYGVAVWRATDDRKSCDHLILVTPDAEARPEDGWSATALAWVPFVEGRARRVVFLRLRHAHTMIDSLRAGILPKGLRERLVARLVGRTLAHELGHVLLNSRDHTMAGLMRVRYRAIEVLRDPPSVYTLDDSQRERLYSNLNGR